jgi:hypothetical protein
MKPSEIHSGFNLSADQGIAQILGIDAAIIFNHIIYWLRINASKQEAKMIDGAYWMYETQQQMAEFFGFYHEDQIAKAIKKLVESGLIIKKCMNKSPFDRTNWYTVYDQSLIKKSLRNPQISGIETLKKSLRNPQISGIENPELAECSHYRKTIEQPEETTTTTAKIASIPSDFAAAAVFFDDSEQANESYGNPVQFKPAVYENLAKIDVPQTDKIEITSRYSEECVKNAIEFAESTKHKIKTTYVAYLKMACAKGLKKQKPNISIYEEISQHFKHGEKYNQAECILNTDGIAFDRGMRHEEMKLDKFFSWEKFESLCKSLGIKFKRNLK